MSRDFMKNRKKDEILESIRDSKYKGIYNVKMLKQDITDYFSPKPAPWPMMIHVNAMIDDLDSMEENYEKLKSHVLEQLNNLNKGS